MSMREKSAKVNLNEVTRLVEALARDLEQVRQGSSDVETLRSEVEQLRAALKSSGGDQGGVHEGLHGIRRLLQKAGDELRGDAFAANEYIARIGRMLGM